MIVHGGDALKHITVSTRKTKDHVFLSICNDGNVLPKASRQHLFERFEQGQTLEQGQALNRHHQMGTGLELAIVKEVCTLHGADISLTSTENKTCIKFRFNRIMA